MHFWFAFNIPLSISKQLGVFYTFYNLHYKLVYNIYNLKIILISSVLQSESLATTEGFTRTHFAPALIRSVNHSFVFD